MTVVINGEETDATPALAEDIADWSKTQTYDEEDKVIYEKVVYAAKDHIAANTAWDANLWEIASTTYAFTFTNVEIEKSGKVKFLIDTYDNAAWNGQTINNISIFKADRFMTEKLDEDGHSYNPKQYNCHLVYDESNEKACNEVA
jgi:hypothetical protein